MSFVASANCALYVGAHPRFADISPDTAQITASSVAKVITKKTKAIVAVHLYGQAAEIGSLIDFAKRFHLKLID